MKRLLILVYQKISGGLKLKKNPIIENTLQELYLPEERERLYKAHQVKKAGVVLLIALIGIVSAVCAYLCSRMEGRLAEGARLERNEWGAGDYSVVLQVQNEENGWEKEVVLEVKERQLTEEETEEMFDQVEKVLPEVIKGNNSNLACVETDLNLITEVKDYPVNISWTTDSERIDRNGKVERKNLLDQGEWVDVTATITYLESKVIVTYQVFLLPEEVSEEERFFRELDEKIAEAEEVTAEDNSFSLPVTLDDKWITWKEVKENVVPQILLLAVVAAYLGVKAADRDLERCLKEKRKQLLAAYPDFVSKLRLYLSAGMTMKSAFFYLMKDYEAGSSEKSNFMYQELRLLCNRLDNGITEEKAYEEWGRRCAEMCYRRLSLLLITNLRQGNKQLLSFLTAEEESAREQRKQQARKLGEEAGIKLLFPMLLQLLVVMFLILIPAYMDFGNI